MLVFYFIFIVITIFPKGVKLPDFVLDVVTTFDLSTIIALMGIWYRSENNMHELC